MNRWATVIVFGTIYVCDIPKIFLLDVPYPFTILKLKNALVGHRYFFFSHDESRSNER